METRLAMIFRRRPMSRKSPPPRTPRSRVPFFPLNFLIPQCCVRLSSGNLRIREESFGQSAIAPRVKARDFGRVNPWKR